MHIEWIKLNGYRNFSDATIVLREKTLVIGANDVGKTNLIYALRILLDRSLTETAMDPDESDFHVNPTTGDQADNCTILIKFVNIDKDAVRASLKGAASDDGKTFIKYVADRATLERRIYVGATEALMEEIPTRHYLRYVSLRYIQSQRDLSDFLRSEKRHLLKLSRDGRSEAEIEEDETLLSNIGESLDGINDEVRRLHYVESATTAVNTELQELAHHHGDYEVRLETGAIQTSQFIEKLELSGTTGGNRIGLGGDGRNNQILLALWKAKSEREQDLDSEAVIYCIEEPEAHLHPHQQRKLASYLVANLRGQVLVTSHSPQITARFAPDSIARLYVHGGTTVAANNGCSVCIEDAWREMGYRISILPAEAFFADMVLLVEGPSEILFYHELARQIDIDLDFYNITILSVDGVDFDVYIKILDAMSIPWALRTDNDVFRVPRSNPVKWQLAGLNRALKLANEDEYEDLEEQTSAEELEEKWKDTSAEVNDQGVFVARVDLETDLVSALEEECLEFANADSKETAIAYLKSRKAIRMGELLVALGDSLAELRDDNLAKPLHYCVECRRT